MFLIYSLLFTLGVVLTAPYYLWRLRGKVVSGAGWQERFGFLPASFQQSAAGAVWVHGVSVGETLAVAGLVKEIQRRYPERKIFLSHVTPAGRAAGETRLPGVAGRFYLPLDWSWSVRRALRRIRPALLLIVETELWPNLLRAAHACGTRVVVVNARLSGRSLGRYRLVRRFTRRVLENVDLICAQSAREAERFRSLGAEAERVVVTGNLKFDAKPPEAGELTARLEKALQLAPRRPVLVAASTMPGEERLLLSAWAEIRRVHPQALLILAPRHPARFETVAQLLAREGWGFVRRTALEENEQKLASQISSAEILLLDTIGELAGIFKVGDVAFVGGSLVPTGGHNLLEPAFWTKPIVCGPHMENFQDIAQLFVEAGAALQVPDLASLSRTILSLVADAGRRQQLGAAAKQLLERESGATLRVLEHLEEWLDEGSPTCASA
jgi:3-deoxy-D-manno-octulosonic-acid transferase